MEGGKHQKILKQTAIYFLITTLVLIPFGTAAFAQGQGSEDVDIRGKMVVDALIIRPLGIVSTVLGTTLFLVSLPFSAMGGNVKEAREKLMVEPARFTFKRPLGEF